MLRTLSSTVLSLSLTLLISALLSGCFWGEADGQLFFKVSTENFEQYEDLLYPPERAERWAEIFGERSTMCSGGEAECDLDSLQRSDLLDLYLPYKTDRARGMITQKGDLQITAHLDVGKAYGELAVESFEDWAYMDDENRLYGRDGDGCDAASEPIDRTGVGRCVRSELLDNTAGYGALDEDLRLVITVNLPGEDDVRSTRCQDRPTTFESGDWSLPRTLRVNYNANEPEEVEDDGEVFDVYGEETPPLAQCDIEVYSRLQLGIEVFSADRYGAEDDDGPCRHQGLPCHLDLQNGSDSTLVGTIELEELVLPGEDGQAKARGRYNISFTSDRFSARDGKVEVSGDFDVELRRDREELDEPDRNLDLEDTDSAQTGS
jgi:hypothetical protein